ERACAHSLEEQARLRSHARGVKAPRVVECLTSHRIPFDGMDEFSPTTNVSPRRSAAVDDPETFYRPSFRDDENDPLQQELNRLYGYADDLETRILHRARLNLFVRLMSELDRDGLLARRESALDIGCNAGGYSRILSDFGYRDVRGIDIEPDLVEKARRRFEGERNGRAIHFQVENAEELDASRRYDFVLCTEVIEHTRRPE